jgi:integrase/recombinase XerD
MRDQAASRTDGQLSTTQIYTHVLDERMKAMVRDLHPLSGE